MGSDGDSDGLERRFCLVGGGGTQLFFRCVVWSSLAPPYQEADSVLLNELLPDFFHESPESAARAQEDFGAFRERTGLFLRLQYPEQSSPIAAVIHFWATQPSYFLKAVSRHIYSLRGSQSSSERGWASLSRQATPIRSRLAVSLAGEHTQRRSWGAVHLLSAPSVPEVAVRMAT